MLVRLFPLFPLSPFRSEKSEHSGGCLTTKTSISPLVSPRGSVGTARGGGLVPRLRVFPWSRDVGHSRLSDPHPHFCLPPPPPPKKKSLLSHPLAPSVFDEHTKTTLNLTLCDSAGVCQPSRTAGAVAEDLWCQPAARLSPAAPLTFSHGTLLRRKDQLRRPKRLLAPSLPLEPYLSTLLTAAVCAQQPCRPQAARRGWAKLASPPTSRTIPGYALAALLTMM